MIAKFLQKTFQKDLWAKIGAIALALFMWFQVTNRVDPLQTRNYVARIQLSSDSGMIPGKPNPETATVTLKGRARTLGEIDAESLLIPVDISSLGVGKHQVPLTFSPPVRGVEVVGISPSTVSVELDVKETKSVQVAVETTGQPNEEFEALAPVIGAASVNVTGPRTLVDKVVAVVGSIDISGAAGNIEGAMVSLTAVDAQNREVPGVTVEPSSIPVSVAMNRRPPAKMVPISAATTGTPKPGYRVKAARVEPISVKVRGDPAVTSGISWIQARSVDVSGRDSTFTVQRDLVVPQGVTLDGVSRVYVTVEIEEDIVEATFRSVFVQFESLPAGFDWDIIPPTVDVTIEGRSDVIKAIKEGDVQAFIDASWIKELGSYKMVVNVKGLPESVRFKAIEPSQVVLELKTR